MLATLLISCSDENGVGESREEFDFCLKIRTYYARRGISFPCGGGGVTYIFRLPLFIPC